MSSTDFVYNNARYLFATGQLDWLTAPINAMLVTENYSPLITHKYVTDITNQANAVLVRDKVLTNLGVTSSGVVYGTIPEIGALLSSSQVQGVVLYSNTGIDGASPLIYFSSGGFGFPFIPVGFSYDIGFDQSNGGYFQV
jgi:hypothetical protein